jgi:hypothetical protein
MAGAVGYGPLGGGDYAALGDFDMAPPPRQEQSCWQRWRGRVFSIGAAAGSVALRIANISPLADAMSSFGVGFFTQASLTLQSTGASLIKIRRVALTTFGQVLVFGLSQLWANDQDAKARETSDHAIIAVLGINAFIVAHWLYQERAIRIESNALRSQEGARFADMRVVSKKASHVMKLLFSGALVASDVLATDPVIKSLSAFGWAFFVCQVVGERLIIFVDGKIQQNDGGDGTNWRAYKTALTTASYVAIPLSMVPWIASPDSSARLKQLQYVGAALGLFDGVLEESKMARIENHPIATLEEFQKIDENGPSTAYRIWKVATPVIFISGLIGFTIWQDGFALKDQDSKIAISSMLGGFLSSYGIARCVDRIWDPAHRNRLKDRAFVFFFASPRILGINPLYLYFAGTNALSMDNHAIAAQQSPLHRITIIASWFFYGSAMGRELYATSVDRMGSAPIKYPLMCFLNAATTMRFVIAGKVA